MGDKGGAIAGGLCMAVLVLAIPIAMIVLGVVHYDECPMDPWIPRFMIISGAIAVFIVLMAIMGFGAAAAKMGCCSGVFLVLAVLAGLALFGWNIAGSVFVFSKWSDWTGWDDATKEQNCHKDTYLFVFAVLIIFWITIPCQTGGSSKAKDVN